MESGLHRLVYYSRNRIPEPDLVDAIADILASSRRNNAASDISGALMFNAGCFGQVLEGRREALEATFNRIQRDARHREVSLLAFEPLAQRGFPHWSMGFVGARPIDARSFAEIGQATGFDPSQATSDKLLAALHKLTIKDEGARG
ncbi:BLUF domain-containing protein [Lichenihabitans sp. Uapishka_5]|uniref:BLUF domain-containing protein n=1 Tax=Lichenihabitans sp. Uapishka_5 TaxID=3037302 RepID=UPI0029E7D304|nr:BLUF domain-containing protein [Lichenihabitans sp. Uapishka_5]MDX7951156.1 BLUF domain-containing protein [Lichenihabitans sp. Uapishka_5]